MSNPFKSCFMILVLLLGLSLAAPARASVDYGLYADLLGRFVKSGVVDYAGFKKNEAELDRFLGLMAKADPAKMDRNQRMAYYINAYNAWTIKLILSKYPDIKSIKDLGGIFSSPWKKEFVKLKGRTVTLDYIENEVLRPEFKDPRVHFAINCASKSCPPLKSEPYLPATLGRQLDASARSFINNPKDNYFKSGTLFLSKIFDWYNRDFGGDAAGYVLKYADKELAKAIRARGKDLDIEYLDYDWSLNGH